jgi:hypothetical protein
MGEFENEGAGHLKTVVAEKKANYIFKNCLACF